jgi:TRAP-type C4-dicarboxylate transport system substrate-binding protein
MKGFPMRKQLLIALCTALYAAPALAADPIALKLASPAPPMSQVNTWGLTPWLEEVNKAAGGALEVKLFPGPALANFEHVYDRTMNGVVEIAFGVFGPYAGQFPRTDVASLPYQTDSTLEASVALWRLFQNGLIAEEYAKVRPLALFAFPASGFHTKKEIVSSEDLHGLKLAVFSRFASKELELLGATPITMTPTDAYQSVQRGLVQGVMVGWSAVLPFKLQEVTTHHLEASLGQAPAFVFMNKEAHAKLPAAAKKAIDGLSYEHFSRRMGDVTERQDDLGRSTVRKIPGHTIYKVAATENARWEKSLNTLVEEWTKATPNGPAILAAYRQELLNVRAGK